MDGINLNISNGLCWSNVNVALEDEYIPCGNVDSGNSYACCHYGDNCLSSNACYHGKYDITYIAGCTSQDFSGPACQNKGDFFDQPWVGLVRCDPDQTLWAGCPETGDIVGTSPPTSNCKCSKDTILFQDKPRLDNIASLPQSLGGTISWFSGYEPTTAISTGIRSTTSSRMTYSTIVPATGSDNLPGLSPQTPTPSAMVPPASEPRLSVGEKAGIGVGSAFGALAVSCLIVIAVILQKRRVETKENLCSQPSLPTVGPGPIQHGPRMPNSAVLGGFKAELPADEPRSATAIAASSIPDSPILTQSPIPDPYQTCHPGLCGNNRGSNVSQLSSGTQGWSESPTSAFSHMIPEEPYSGATESAHSRAGQPGTIHELQ
ncbi:hypothetical protein F4859DRAFT_513084 [Xylaria cf. heliscus]|nr:hypothetical protein F4859DRAFT_513084 [Xylaria cf. heliscus]